MKKLLLISLLSLSLLSQSLTPAFAQIKITIPTAQELEQINDLQLDMISSFLEENQITQRCLRRNEEDRNITALTASCIVLQVFDRDATIIQHWEKAEKLKLFNGKTRNDSINGLEFLASLFDIAGETISPLSESNYRELFRSFRLRLTPEELKTLATALEKGLIPEPTSQLEAAALRRQLASNSLKVREALAYLYQVATSQHSDTTIINLTPITPASESLELEDILKEVFKIIKTQSYFNESFDEKAAMEAAIKAAVKTLEEDKYIEYYTSDEFQSFSEGLNGNLEGIGAYIEEKEGSIIIISPIEGSPAQKAGILPGDIITHINSESTEGLSLQEAVNKIRGPQGTSVKLTIRRNGSVQEFTITRNKITIPAISVSNQQNVEVIKLVQFGNTSAQEMKAELETITQKNPEAIVIDLRNNPGGFLNEVVTIVDYFLPKNTPVVYLNDKHQRTSLDTELDPIVKNIPIGILINKGSASASEILAGVLQSFGIAKIYGETSFGKGTVQNIVSLQSQDQRGLSAFKFTTAEYLIGNPKGEPISIDGIGVKPDSNPDGNPLLDNKDTPEDDALQAVIKDLVTTSSRRR